MSKPIKKRAKVQLLESPRTTLDNIRSAKVRSLLEHRRATGMPEFKELMRLSEDDDEDDEVDETARERSVVVHPRISSPQSITSLSPARYMVRMSVLRRLGSIDPAEKACPHPPNVWCVCSNRFHGYSSTFADKSQPPYTVWHAGTDYVRINLPESGNLSPDDLTPVDVFNLSGEDGFLVQICNYGAQVTSILMADQNGLIEEVMPFFPNMLHTQNNAHLYMSGLYGRIGARITNGSIKGKGFDSQLELNEDNKHHINGGVEAGFDRLPWQAAVAGNELVLTLVLPDGAGGYPGTLLLTARYCIRPRNTLSFRLAATCTRPCPLLPVMRIPLNLSGHGSGKAGMLEHVIKINASQYYATNKKDFTPNGQERRVADSVYDLRVTRALSTMHPLAPWPGYRVYYRLDADITRPTQKDGARLGEDDGEGEDAPLPFAAKLLHPQSRRAVELRTNQPVLYFETVRMTMPTDSEDIHEEMRRASKQLKQQRTKKNSDKSSQNTVSKKFEYLGEEEGEEGEDGGEEEEDYDEEEENIKKSSIEEKRANKSALAFDDDVVEHKFEDQTKTILGRGGFHYNRCGAITLQPQREPLFKGKKTPAGGEGPMDGTRQLLQPGRRLLYAATWRFYLEPFSEKPQRQRKAARVRYAKAGERLEDARARFDDCDVDVFGAEPPADTPKRDVTPPPMIEETPKELFEQADLQADRCSVESVFQDKSRYDRVFMGPPTDPVPPPKPRKQTVMIEKCESDLCSILISDYIEPPMSLHSYADFVEQVGKIFLKAIQDDFVHDPSTNSGVASFIHDPFRPTIAPRVIQQLRDSWFLTPCNTPISLTSGLEKFQKDHHHSISKRDSGDPPLSKEEKETATNIFSEELRISIEERVNVIKKLSDDSWKFLNDQKRPKKVQEGQEEDQIGARSLLHHSLQVRGNSLERTVKPTKSESKNNFSDFSRNSIFGYDIDESGKDVFTLFDAGK